MNGLKELSYALDTFYFLMSGALVMWMAAGFAMLEAGLVRGKNTAEILTKNVALFATASIMYLLVGYQIMYGSSLTSVIPGLGFLIGADNTTEAVLAGGDGAPYYSNLSDFFFQVVFVATAMSIVSGAVAERMKLWAFLAFAVIMTGFIYPVQGMWTWGGGWLDQAGFSDFAGSGIVHMAGASAALAGVLLLGPRRGKYGPGGVINAIPGANLPLATLGTFVLWLGWFGFNGGSELAVASVESANNVARVFVNTNAAAAAGVVAALLTARVLFGKADLTMTLNGALAGLVAITAEPLAPTPLLATVVGAVGGILVVFSIVGLDKLKIDDPVGAISVHGVVGIWGLLAVLLSNEGASLGGQLLGIVGIFAWVFLASLLVWGVLKAVVGIRVSEELEYEGLDLSECGLEAYPEFEGSRT
ncbi:ammonium transporter [Thiohalorhabdus denitrificans]|uniref:ammonium transporter n=1 Tax=Thiohalorhabdus denitrificans TaxID=381306 RepID=UPI0006D55273|nr:ammonium transporter [Thiohalorhabdus denitrificans]KPV41255.1 ammonium transporter [Thiohalorhabdus denitrificans]